MCFRIFLISDGFDLCSALTATESDGSLLIEQYVPCSLCTSRAQREAAPPREVTKIQDGQQGGGASVHYFSMEDCVLAAVEKDYIFCPQHLDQPVPLQELVPELFMTDFPAR